MYSRLKKHLEDEALTEEKFADCKYRIDYKKELFKSLMLDLGIGTLFISYNSLLDEIQIFSSDSNCADDLICLCDECKDC